MDCWSDGGTVDIAEELEHEIAVSSSLLAVSLGAFPKLVLPAAILLSCFDNDWGDSVVVSSSPAVSAETAV